MLYLQPINGSTFSMKKFISSLICIPLLWSCGDENSTYTNTTEIPVEGETVAQLTSPPFVPAPVGNRKATKLSVTLEIIEKEGELAVGTKYLFWTFGGTVPGNFIRARVGDEVSFTLKNHPLSLLSVSTQVYLFITVLKPLCLYILLMVCTDFYW